MSSPSAHIAWVRSKGAGAPPALLARVEQVLSLPELAAKSTVEALVAAAEYLAAAVVRPRDGDARAAALDLLAADACVTWAFEAAADEPETLAARAEDAMRRITKTAVTA